MMKSSCVRAILIVIVALLLVGSIVAAHKNPSPSHPGQIVILSKSHLYCAGKMNAIVWQFNTDDISNIDENRKVAQKILPSGIQQAVKDNVSAIVIQAVKRKKMLIINMDSSYGYVWEKDTCGQWILQPVNKPDSHAKSGEAYLQQQNYQLAVDAFTLSLKLSPNQSAVLAHRGFCYAQLRQYDKAIDDFTTAIGIVKGDDPDSIAERGNIYYLRGLTYNDMQKGRECIIDMKKFISLLPTDVRVSSRQYALANNDIAWFMATSSDASVRNGREALRYAKNAVTYVKDDLLLRIGTIDTLAAAEARSGDYTLAVSMQMKALKLCTDAKMREEIEQRLRLYEQKMPYTQQD